MSESLSKNGTFSGRKGGGKLGGREQGREREIGPSIPLLLLSASGCLIPLVPLSRTNRRNSLLANQAREETPQFLLPCHLCLFSVALISGNCF